MLNFILTKLIHSVSCQSLVLCNQSFFHKLILIKTIHFSEYFGLEEEPVLFSEDSIDLNDESKI